MILLISNFEDDSIQNKQILRRLGLRINRSKKICYFAGIASVTSLDTPIYPLLARGSTTITF